MALPETFKNYLIFLYLMGSTALIFYMLPSLALHWRIVLFLVWVAGVIFMVHHTFEPIEFYIAV